MMDKEQINKRIHELMGLCYQHVVKTADNTNTYDVIYKIYKNGRQSKELESQYDLINIPEKITGWVNMYDDYVITMHKSKELADKYTHKSSRIACIKVEFEEGEGL